LKILDVELKFNKPFNVSVKSAKLFIKKSLNLGHYEALKKDVAGIINCPINKELLQKKNQGVTEFLSSKCNIKDGSEVMLIKSKKTSVAPITTHLDLKNVPKKISSKLIIKKIITINSWFKKIYKKKPRLAILGLNPHNAEMKKDSEEIKKIIPAIKKLKKIGIKVTGPLVADTVFMNEYKNFDVIVGMYHDQVLPSFKSIFKFDAINITLGIKYLRLSPDHGVAKNIMKKKIANYMSLLKCIEFLQKFK
jgi:4-hydroxythreonine-4-phosphate dehydrogenase